MTRLARLLPLLLLLACTPAAPEPAAPAATIPLVPIETAPLIPPLRERLFLHPLLSQSQPQKTARVDTLFRQMVNGLLGAYAAEIMRHIY
jgi:hypothetical protein